MREQIFEGRVALVAGSSRGLGAAIAARLAAGGADLFVNYVENKDRAAAVVEGIRASGRSAEAIRADVSEPDEVAAMFQRIRETRGQIDILVNNAGINLDKTARKMDPAVWSRVVEVDLSGVFHCCRAAVQDPAVLRPAPTSRIVNISSVVGQMGNFGQANYAAAKAGVIGLTKSLARELAASGVTVNAVAPGFAETDMTRGMPPAVLDGVVAQVPLKRLARPEEIAEAVAYLCSPLAGYVTGAVLDVNGGYHT